VEGGGNLVLIQNDHGLFVPLYDCQVRIGALRLCGELGPSLIWLGAGEPTFSGTQADEHELVVFAALQIQRPAVCPIREDRLSNLSEGKGFVEAGGIGGRDAADQITKEAAQVLHR
jgi:hypothetical protein